MVVVLLKDLVVPVVIQSVDPVQLRSTKKILTAPEGFVYNFISCQLVLRHGWRSKSLNGNRAFSPCFHTGHESVGLVKLPELIATTSGTAHDMDIGYSCSTGYLANMCL